MAAVRCATCSVGSWRRTRTSGSLWAKFVSIPGSQAVAPTLWLPLTRTARRSSRSQRRKFSTPSGSFRKYRLSCASAFLFHSLTVLSCRLYNALQGPRKLEALKILNYKNTIKMFEITLTIEITSVNILTG